MLPRTHSKSTSRRPRQRALTLTAAATLFVCSSCRFYDPGSRPTVELDPTPQLQIAGNHWVEDFPAKVGALVNVVVEIPVGTHAKWEVEEDGVLRWQQQDGAGRIVQYLGYPGNYGMIPRTLSASESGGDGDPLDVLILGECVDRGQVVQARIIGALKMLDRGERDDKLLAVRETGIFRDVDSLATLKSRFPGALEIVVTWFSNYKGSKKMRLESVVDAAEAQRLATEACAAYERKHRAPQGL